MLGCSLQNEEECTDMCVSFARVFAVCFEREYVVAC